MLILGDVHGCYKTLKKLISQFPNEEVCFVGDLIDRGPSSRLVLEFVIDSGYKSVKGNHEEMVKKFFFKNDNIWLNPSNGGDKVLKEFNYFETSFNKGKKFAKEELLKTKEFQFLLNLPSYLEFEIFNSEKRKLFVTHSYVSKVWHYKNKSDTIYKDSFDNHILWARPKLVEDIPNILMFLVTRLCTKQF